MALSTRSSVMPWVRKRCTMAWRRRSELSPRLPPCPAAPPAGAGRARVAGEMRVLLLAAVTPGARPVDPYPAERGRPGGPGGVTGLRIAAPPNAGLRRAGCVGSGPAAAASPIRRLAPPRSEEHTSELQSRENL